MSNFASEAGHWYAEDGSPAYEIPAKNGELRPTTLRDARKFNLVPSVTMIMRCASAPALENWKRQQLLLSAMTLPRIDGENTEAYAARVLKDSEEQSTKAREIGTIIHGCIEKHLCGEVYDQTYAVHVAGALACLDDWCGLDGIRPEKSFAHRLGFGGKCDVHKHGPGFVADFKSKEFTEAELPKAWDDHAMQLRAYAEGFGLVAPRCAIIYVSTKVPGLTHLVEIEQDELDRGWEMFKTLLRFWQFKNRYAPITMKGTENGERERALAAVSLA